MTKPASAKPEGPLRRGWTTGACATAAVKAAYTALLTGAFPDPVEIVLPRGERPSFPLARATRTNDAATAGIVKDAGDDPDVTHGALVLSTVYHGVPGSGVIFRAGPGVGTVTKPGLPIPPGEPAINPVPRAMMRAVVEEVAAAFGGSGDVVVEVSVENGEALARKTWNPRLGIVGGLSILGTTGVVVPFSCSAWIHSIQRGVDVSRALGLTHVAGCTGSTSEALVQRLYGLDESALLDMGDFAGGLLKYLRRHPLPRLTIAGGFAKMVKLGQGALDLHSGRSQVDLDRLAELLERCGADPGQVAAARTANTAKEVLDNAAGLPLADAVAEAAQRTALDVLDGAPVAVEVLVVDRAGHLVGRAG
ncbi:cobalt-precorrin-5B (C(1))-methyltransferase [Azospirillum sp. TSO22-1]|uniref:cobalt-precorrin-5B (C(1))-methyltransferase n=1 Tax=Azospirillum sp. TSO22-1 TaxID=716789 RepID=UPI000D6129D9|nr:cobalt-precorrin-5B (C(1))-methyltransferase [Azospirillum sp. TSO22-1]PWC55195.1 cobalt-precorrin-6A synthase [Azospirillum sp. TSO22-1]